jgi:hypothetical protein
VRARDGGADFCGYRQEGHAGDIARTRSACDKGRSMRTYIRSSAASLMHLMGKFGRHPNARARNRDRKVQLYALTAGICFPPMSWMVLGTD